RFPYDVTFSNSTVALFPGSGAPPIQEVLGATMAAGGQALPGASAATEFELVGGADPYFTNVDPAQANGFYLSQDLRQFTATPALDATPVAGGPAFGSDSVAGAYQYIRDLVAWLNDPAHPFTDGTQDPFATGVIPSQAGALTGDSSVTPFTLSLFPLALD